MTADPRAALAAFIAALEAHLELSAVRRGEDDPAVVAAYEKVADTFVAYDDALLATYGEVTPLDLPDEDDEDDDELLDEAELAELEDEDEDDDEGEDEGEDEDEDEDDDEGDWDDDYDLDEDDDDEGGSYVGLDVEEYDVEDGAGAPRR